MTPEFVEADDGLLRQLHRNVGKWGENIISGYLLPWQMLVIITVLLLGPV